MKSSKFDLGKLNLVAVQTGVKGSNDVEPTLTLQGIPNKFQLNRLATKLIGLKVKDRVNIFNNKDAKDINEKYFLAKVAKDGKLGAKVNRSNSTTKLEEGIDMAFNYSGVWGVCLQGDPNAAELGYEALEAKGLVVSGKTSGGKGRWRSAIDVKFTVEEAGTAEIDGVTYELFALTNYTASPKSEDELEKVKTESAPENEESEEDVDVEDVDADDVDADDEE